MARTLDVSQLISPHQKASHISNKFDEWNSYRSGWVDEKKELRNYVYATDTRTTGNAKLPWSNSTTTPKLTQIYDNLKANYTASLFPSNDWMEWQADDNESASKRKRDFIQSYMENKLRQSDFRNVVDRLVDDFILAGNCFATVEWDRNYTELESGETVEGYIGPKLVRISPYDIVFDPTAADFASTPKIVRSVKTLGEVQAMFEKQGKMEIFAEMMRVRDEVGSAVNISKSEGFVADGFGSLQNYYGSSYVEFLTFYGDMYDRHERKLHRNRIITVVDRAYLVEDIANPRGWAQPQCSTQGGAHVQTTCTPWVH